MTLVDESTPLDEINNSQDDQLEETVQVPSPPSNQKFIRIALSFILIVLLISFSLLSKRLRLVLDQMELSQSPVIAAIAKIIPNILPTPTPVPLPLEQQVPTGEKTFYLEYLLDGHVATLAAIPEYSSLVAAWKDTIIFTQPTATQGAGIYQLNLTTQQTTKLFTIADSDPESKQDHLMITSLEVDHDTLLFSLTAYLNAGHQYILDLAHSGPAQEVSSIMSGDWERDNQGRLWLRGGFGDGCAGEIKLYHVNSSTWVPQLVADYSTACGEGQLALGVDTHNRLLLAGYTGTPNEIEIPVYSYITSIHINDPSIIEGIIAKQDFPAHITQIQFNPNTDQILMASESATLVYDLSTALTTISATPIVDNQPNTLFPYVSLQTKIEQITLPENYRWSNIQN